jgi:hypothetical protein
VTDAEIHDWKSYYQIIDPDTFQSKFYPLLLMCLNPSLQRVKFVLEFIRYGASRSTSPCDFPCEPTAEASPGSRYRGSFLPGDTAQPSG